MQDGPLQTLRTQRPVRCGGAGGADQPGTFELALAHLVGGELDLAALDGKFSNDTTGASACNPRVMLKVVLLACGCGLITGREIEAACEQDVLCMAVSGGAHANRTPIVKFVRAPGPWISDLFAQALMTCDRLGLIGRTVFAIDGVKLPRSASKERSGAHAELPHRAQRLGMAEPISKRAKKVAW